MYQFGGYFQNYVDNVLKQYQRHQPLLVSVAIGFPGVASERVTVFTPQIDADALLFGVNVDFSNANVTLKITDTQSGYVWNTLQSNAGTTISGTPITAIAGIQTQVTPVLPLVCPFLLSRQSKLQFDFQNSASSPTTGGNITFTGIKLFAAA
jgi:hypothetical protein